jgi:hypothetical protein
MSARKQMAVPVQPTDRRPSMNGNVHVIRFGLRLLPLEYSGL